MPADDSVDELDSYMYQTVSLIPLVYISPYLNVSSFKNKELRSVCMYGKM